MKFGKILAIVFSLFVVAGAFAAPIGPIKGAKVVIHKDHITEILHPGENITARLGNADVTIQITKTNETILIYKEITITSEGVDIEITQNKTIYFKTPKRMIEARIPPEAAINVTKQMLQLQLKREISDEEIKQLNLTICKFNNKSICYRHRHRVKAYILGIIPVPADIDVEVDAETGSVYLIRPWWWFLVLRTE